MPFRISLCLVTLALLLAPWQTARCQGDQQNLTEQPPSEGIQPPSAPTLSQTPDGRALLTYRALSLRANNIDYKMDSQDIHADGNVLIDIPEGLFTVQQADFNLRTRVGQLTQAKGEIDPFHFTAKTVSLNPEKKIHLQGASLTTCSKEHPHYELITRDFTIDGEKRFTARRISLAVSGHRLFTFPGFQGNLSDNNMAVAKPTFMPGISSIDGLYLGAYYSRPLGKDTDLTLNGRLGTKGLLRGGIYATKTYTAPWKDGHIRLSLVATHREDVENRLIDLDETVDNRLEDLTISRLPAAQISLDQIHMPGFLRGYTLQLGGGFGHYREHPTGVSENRALAWGILSTPKFKVGPALFHAEYGLRGTYYEGNKRQGTYAAQLTLESPPKSSFYYNVSFLDRRETGETPFLFDKVLIPRELFTEFEVPIAGHGRWRLGFWNRQDLDAGRTRDFNVTAIYGLDCISYGLSYNYASESIGFGIVLNAFGSFHRGVGPIGFTQ